MKAQFIYGFGQIFITEMTLYCFKNNEPVMNDTDEYVEKKK